MKHASSLTVALGLLAFVAFLLPGKTHAAVLTLEFADGNGSASVDQFTGIIGSGWSSAWQSVFHSGTANGSASVISDDPLVPGGGNYLHVTYNTQASGTSLARLARQWDTASLLLTTPITISFEIRSDVNVASTSQSFVLFGSSSSAAGTSSADSWKITADGGGWHAFSGNTVMNFNSGTISADETWLISVTIDPVSDTYSALVRNLTMSSESFTLTGLSLRNGADASLSWLNIHSYGAASLTGLGYSIDNVSVVPEPGIAVTVLVGLGGLLLLARKSVRP